jgi:hypothetical protein
MTDERATHDGTDTENETDSNATQSGGDGGLGRRGFLKGAAASVAGGGGARGGRRHGLSVRRRRADPRRRTGDG